MTQVVTDWPIYFYPHGSSGPKIRLDRLSDEKLQMFAAILEENFERTWGDAVHIDMRLHEASSPTLEDKRRAEREGCSLMEWVDKHVVYATVHYNTRHFTELPKHVRYFKELAGRLT
jgi:hypothetical protein